MKTNIDDDRLKAEIHRIGLLNNLTDKQVKEIVEAQFRFAYEIIKNLNLSELSDEEIDNLKTNFYFKYIGKLFTNSEVIRRHKLNLKIKQEYLEEYERTKEY